MKLSEKICYCRKKCGLSQEALAERVGVSRQAVSKWENGDAEPELGKLRLLADTFDVTADWLLSDAEPPQTLMAPPVSEPPLRPTPEAAKAAPSDQWLDAPPGFIGRMLRQYGWLYGVYVALSGLGLTVVGCVAKMLADGMERSFNMDWSGFAPGGLDGFEMSGALWYDEFGNQIANPLGGASGGGDMFDPVSALAMVFIVVGVLGMIAGVALALWMRRREWKGH